MRFKEQIKYINKHLINKKSTFYIIILTLLIILSLTGLTIIKVINNYKTDLINKSYEARTLIVYTSDTTDDFINKLMHYKNITFVGSTKYLNGGYFDIQEFNTDIPGLIQVLPLVSGINLSTNNNVQRLDDNQIICPKKFYPHSLAAQNEDNDDIKWTIKYNDIVNGTNYVNKKINLKSENDDKYYEFNIVGTYNQEYSMNAINTCFISQNAYDKIVSPYSGHGIGTDINGNKFENHWTYENLMVLVDDYKNVENVIKELNKDNYSVDKYFQLDQSLIKLYIYIPLFIILIVLVVIINIIINFLSKKIKNKIKTYGILSAVGFSNNEIIKLEILENSILFGIIAIISFVIFKLLSIIIIHNYFYEFTYNNINMNLPIRWFALYYSLLFGIIILINYRKINKLLRKNTSTLLKSEQLC